MRLDVYLAGQCEDRSRSQFKKLIMEGLALVNGEAEKPGYEVRAGDEIEVRFPEEAEDGLTPQPMPLEILYEDEDILVLNKAPGLVIHPGAGHEEGTLVHGLLAHCPRLSSQGAPLRPGIVHRLDQDTSGGLVVAKSERAYLDLIGQFKDHTVRKEYLALVYGTPSKVRGEIRTRIDRHPVDRKRMAVTEKNGREAISLWHVEETWGEVSLLRVMIETGRTHQIRVHLSHLNHPVVGDETYGGGKRRARSVKSKALSEILTGVNRQMLHAWKLGFDHPVNRKALAFIAPIPPDFSQLLDDLRRLVASTGS